MPVISCYTDLRHLEADCVQEQSEVLQGLATDLQYAVSILNYKAHGFENQSLAARKSAFEATSGHAYEGSTLANWQTEEEERRAKKLIKNNTLVLDAAEHVKIGLKKMIEIVCGDPSAVEPCSKNNGLLGETAEIDSETTSGRKATLSSPLEDQLTKELTQARRIFVDSSYFVPVNFHALSTPIQGQAQIIDDKMENLKQVQKVRLIDDAAMSKCQEATKALSSIIQFPRGRGRPKGSKNKPHSTHVELPGGLTAIKKGKDAERSRSPPRGCSMEEMEKQLLAWIPPKIDVSRIPKDEKIGELLVHEAKSIRGKLAY